MPLAARVLVPVCLLLSATLAIAQEIETPQYRVLATTKTSTMETEMQEAAEAGFRFGGVMGGETAFGGQEVVVVMVKDREPGSYGYRLLATNKTSTMEKELQAAGDAGFEYRGQTVFKSTFGGQEVVVILERNGREPVAHYDYRLVATSKTSTFQKELTAAGDAGYAFVGLTVAKTAIGGSELVAILRRPVAGP
jgi:hypothetical protein